MDKGWIYSIEEAAWLLLNRLGLVVRRITDEFLAAYGAAQVNNYGARHGWPELVPGAPYIVCVLAGGAMDGRHWFFSPAERSAPPDEVILDYDGEPLVYRRTGRGRGPAYLFALAG